MHIEFLKYILISIIELNVTNNIEYFGNIEYYYQYTEIQEFIYLYLKFIYFQ